jgi:hypothetical protein
MALWMVALFFPVAEAAFDSVYFMLSRRCCALLHLLVAQRVALLRFESSSSL